MAVVTSSLVDISPQVVRELDDDGLAELWRRLAAAWEDFVRGARPDLPEGLNREEFVNRAVFVAEEMERRGLPPPAPDQAPPALVFEVIRLMRESVRVDRAACERLFQGAPQEVVLQPDFVRLDGPFLTDPAAADGHVEVMLHARRRDPSRDLKLQRVVAGAVNREVGFTLCPDGFPDDHEPLGGFDLVLRKRPALVVDDVAEPEFQARVYGGRLPEALEGRRRALLDGLADFVQVPGFVSVTGSFVYHDPARAPNDVDVVVKSGDVREDVQEVLGASLGRAAGSEVHWVWEPRGPNWTSFPLYDLVCRVRRPASAGAPLPPKDGVVRARESRVRALKVPDPEFLLRRLDGDFEALLLSAMDRSALAGEELLLVNERIKEREPVRAWAFVAFEQEAGTVRSVEELGERAEALDNITRREFKARRGPFHVLSLRLVRALDEPVEIEPPPGRRFSGEFEFREAELEEGVKQAFGSPGGKSRLVKQIVPYIPEHRVYVEPFAGGAAIFFAKKPSDVEALNDKDPEIAHALRMFQKYSAKELDQKAANFDWIGRKENIQDAWRGGGAGVTRLFRFLYGLRGSFSRNRKDVAPACFGQSLQPQFSEGTHERLESTRIRQGDYREVIRNYDAKDAFFFIDPPYPKEWPRERTEGRFDLAPLASAIRRMKGKFLLTVDKSPEMRRLFDGFHFKTLHRITSFTKPNQQARPDKRDWDEEYLIANFPFHANSKWLAESVDDSGAQVTQRSARLFGAVRLRPGSFFMPQKPAVGFREPDALAEQARLPSQTEQRKALERRIGDWLLVEQPANRSFPAVVQRHSRGIWSEAGRKGLLADVRKASARPAKERDEELQKLWRDGDMEWLKVPFAELKRAVTRAQDERRPVTPEMNRRLSKKFPGARTMLRLLEQDRIVNRGSAHLDLRSTAPADDHLVGWTLDTPGVMVHFLKGGQLREAGRNKYLTFGARVVVPGKERVEVDRILVQKKSPQPVGWLTLVTPRKPTFEAELGQVGATEATAGRIDLVTGSRPFTRSGQDRPGFSVVYGVRRSDFHEQFHFHEDPEMNRRLGGRWTFRLLALGGRPGVPETVSWLMRRADDPAPFVFKNDFDAEVSQARKEKNDLLWNFDAVKALGRMGYFKTWGLEDALAEWEASPRGAPPPRKGVARFRPKGRVAKAPEIFAH